MIETLSILFFLSFSALSGIIEGVLYSKKAAAAFSWDEHIMYVLHRVCVAGLFLLPETLNHFCPNTFPLMPFYDKLAISFFWGLAHSFVHDGFYYETRRQIDVPEYRWDFDFSPTSTARFEVSFRTRTVAMMAGVAGLIIYFMIKQ